MNIKIRGGYIWINERRACEMDGNIFSEYGKEIPSVIIAANNLEKQPARYHAICKKCQNPHDPALCCHQPKENRTMGRFDIAELLESLAKRFDTRKQEWIVAGGSYEKLLTASGAKDLAEDFRAEKENWK